MEIFLKIIIYGFLFLCVVGALGALLPAVHKFYKVTMTDQHKKIILIAALIYGLYWLMSPYETCMRNNAIAQGHYKSWFGGGVKIAFPSRLDIRRKNLCTRWAGGYISIP
jgi:hypothetical protein